MNKGWKIFSLGMLSGLFAIVTAAIVYQKRTEPRRKKKEQFINEIPSLDSSEKNKS